jgi:hypothetical protein
MRNYGKWKRKENKQIKTREIMEETAGTNARLVLVEDTLAERGF